MAFPQIAVFASSANGDAAPIRRIAGQATKISRADHDIEYDPVNDEIVVGNPEGQAILTLRGGANGEEPPIRIIQGPHTQINDPGYGTFVDAVHNELYVCEKEYVLVFPRTANGDVPPIRVIRGANTMLANARGIEVDPTRNLIFVATNNGMLIFSRTDNGDVAPRAAVKGPMSGIRGTIQNFRLSPKGYLVAVMNGGFGGGGEDGEGGGGGGAGGAGVAAEGRGGGGRGRGPGGGPGGITAWSLDELASLHGKTDLAPAFVLSNPKGGVTGQRIALNPKGKEAMVGGSRSVDVYSFPEIF